MGKYTVFRGYYEVIGGVMTDDEELYELIYCSQYGAENRLELMEKYAHKAEDLKKKHEKSGLKLNGKVINE